MEQRIERWSGIREEEGATTLLFELGRKREERFPRRLFPTFDSTFDSYILKSFFVAIFVPPPSLWIENSSSPSMHPKLSSNLLASSPNNHTILISFSQNSKLRMTLPLIKSWRNDSPPSLSLLFLSLILSFFIFHCSIILLYPSVRTITSGGFDNLFEIFEICKSLCNRFFLSTFPLPLTVSLSATRFSHTLACASSAHPSRSPGVARRNGRLETDWW